MKDKPESDFHLPKWPTTFPSAFQGFRNTGYSYNILKSENFVIVQSLQFAGKEISEK